ncbi:Cytochrome c oxidase assembly protein cox15 [Rasamsonia emersonii CBS 393.64]|uniref:Cytochrome c oxidase assembly protein cox15 n=1 Tax=Rasamsonia emersonii (strain ATCC 16479 / CBS 393.64 / IMI 116815) TaxID=1408163 RepID=A0A0F4Z5G3_RASE3|nr:Cytochrome c oxidase assembly protein cox15 [Rasamsonia emersonii CBS 393.64]KKA25769.1 Cytochrome c oxidase assembly protein cox15 [Rasamsonia emersonii CBS 393.64]
MLAKPRLHHEIVQQAYDPCIISTESGKAQFISCEPQKPDEKLPKLEDCVIIDNRRPVTGTRGFDREIPLSGALRVYLVSSYSVGSQDSLSLGKYALCPLLSITEWKPVTGSIPPLSDEDWESEFAKYRASPEFQLLNPHMNLSEFKSIYYMEWIHRLWGRFVGLSFVIPAVYFVAKKKVSKPMAWRLAGIAGLIGFQGFIGWWMVKSGLKDDLFAPGSHPRVSQYRLTAHLAAAFTCYVAMLWNGLAILRSHRLLADPEAGINLLNSLQNPKLKIFRRSVAVLGLLVFTTAMSGALVAGLDAGLIYNEFPTMGNGLTPPKSELFDERYSRKPDKSDLWWRNMLENPSLVQLDHRILAMTTFTSVMALWAYTRGSPTMRRLLPPAAKKGVHGVVAFTFVQVALGISTLLYLVPTHLASTHQAGSLFLLTWVLVLGSRVWHPSRTAKLLQMAVKARNQSVSASALNATSKL